MNLQVIKNLCEKQGRSLKQLAAETGMSEPNLHRCIRLNKIQASDLEQLARVMDVPIHMFFDQSLKNPEATPAQLAEADMRILRERVTLLEQLLEEKERLIKVLMER
ncbi:MAG: helix-turn-helix transcriptional regulator [Prevotella sp.]|nr:helix-turn-helix transcriptional regulator [Prevotella sp.]